MATDAVLDEANRQTSIKCELNVCREKLKLEAEATKFSQNASGEAFAMISIVFPLLSCSTRNKISFPLYLDSRAELSCIIQVTK